MSDSVGKSCLNCGTDLKEPFISCVECVSPRTFLCLSCFARGEEKNGHKSGHVFEIIKNNFSILEPEWTARDELNLLDAIYDCGVGNWDDVSNQMGTRSKQECESHYYKCYIENPKTPMIEFAEQNGQDLNFPTPITHKICDDPPRPALDSQMYNEMAGYMAGRGDFNTEYDNYAEHDICRMEFLEDDDDVDTNLKLSVLRIYNHRLHERARRKRILARYGLINIRKAGFSLRRYHSLIGSHVIDGLVGFMQLVEPVSFDLFTESLLHEAELKRKIKALQEFREAGLTRFFSTKLYSHLKQRRNDRKNKPRHLDNVLDHIQNKTRQNWLHRHIIAETKERKAAPPLEIEELEKLPGYEKINSDERELCSQVRLRPQDYIDIKEMLINECQKLGQIRLSNARTLIKIDVNKTRKIFDYLVAEGLIGTPSIKKS